MKKIKLIPVEIEEEFDDYEDIDAEEGGTNLSFEFDLNPYITACAIVCAVLFVVRFVKKHFFDK